MSAAQRRVIKTLTALTTTDEADLKSYWEAKQQDAANGNGLWKEATEMEMETLKKLGTYELAELPPGWKPISNT